MMTERMKHRGAMRFFAVLLCVLLMADAICVPGFAQPEPEQGQQVQETAETGAGLSDGMDGTVPEVGGTDAGLSDGTAGPVSEAGGTDAGLSVGTAGTVAEAGGTDAAAAGGGEEDPSAPEDPDAEKEAGPASPAAPEALPEEPETAQPAAGGPDEADLSDPPSEPKPLDEGPKLVAPDDDDADVFLIEEGPDRSADEDGEDAALMDDFIVTVDVTGSGTAGDPFCIKTGDGLKMIAEAIQSGTIRRDCYCTLMNNVSLSGAGNWPTIGTSSMPFAGVFDGGGYSVTGLYISGTGEMQGLFGLITGTVKNLNVSGTVSGSNYVGGIVGANGGRVENCTFSGTVQASKECAGGVAGLTSGTVVDCRNEGTVSASKYAGGITGKFQKGDISNCVNTGSISCSGTFAGGIVGLKNSGSLQNCRNEGKITGAYVGGIVGQTKSDVSGCLNYGEIGGGDFCGGITGYIYSARVFGCYNYAGVSGNCYQGGISGYAESQSTISDCENFGTVEGTDRIGGIVGETNKSRVTRCGNTAMVQCSQSESNMPTAGGIVGFSLITSQVDHCFNTGIISLITSSRDGRIGGITGELDYNDSKISCCINTGSVICDAANAGGISGWVYASSVERCCNMGDVFSTISLNGNRYGGITAYMDDATIQNCCNSGSIGKATRAGGIVGVSNAATVKQCGSTGTVDTNSEYAGVFVGRDNNKESGGTFQYNYYIDYSGCPKEVGNHYNIKYSDSQFYGTSREKYCDRFNDNCFKTWDFNNIWVRTLTEGPRLRGLGSEESSVDINSVEDLKRFRDSVNCGMSFAGVTLNLGTDLDLSGEGSWIPIGRNPNHWEYKFEGVFDGCGHTIKGLTISRDDEKFIGLFGQTEYATVKNLKVKGSVTGGENTGGIVGSLDGSNLENCSFTGTVIGEENVGGLAGIASYTCNLTGCAFDGSVTGSANNVGGIIGQAASSGTISRCSVTGGTVKGAVYVGGIVGMNNSADVENCIHIGNVTSPGTTNSLGCAGGIAGSMPTSGGSIKYCCHYSGDIYATYYAGGIVGYKDAPSSIGDYRIERCYYLSGTVSNYVDSEKDKGIGGYAGSGGEDNPAGAASPLTADQFAKKESFTDWNFTDIWSMFTKHPVLTGINGIVFFKANGGSGSMNDYLIPTGGGTLPVCTFSLSGRGFMGWNTKADGSGDWYADGAWVDSSSPMDLYAIWGSVVSFHANGGRGSMDDYLIPAGGGTLPACVFTYNTLGFVGWNTRDNASGEWYADKAKVEGSLQRLDLYAIWGKYVTFHANGGSGSMENCLIPTTGGNLPACTLTPTGDAYFIGWNTKADGSGTWYADEGWTKGSAQLNLYAIWGHRESVSYVNSSGVSMGAHEAARLGPGVNSLNGWYYAEGTVTYMGDRLEVSGDVNLILKDGSTLNVPCGIHVPEDSSLTVWGQAGKYAVPDTEYQTQGTGQLIAGNRRPDAESDTTHDAAIGSDRYEMAGTINLYGGVINATGSSGAAIGSGADAAAGLIDIRGCCVTAKGSSGSAAIGGGYNGDGGSVSITNSYVDARGGNISYDGNSIFIAAGIGAGAPRDTDPTGRNFTSVSIDNSYVYAQSMMQASGFIWSPPIGANSSNSSPTGTISANRVSIATRLNGQVPLSSVQEACSDRWGWVLFTPSCSKHAGSKGDGDKCIWCGVGPGDEADFIFYYDNLPDSDGDYFYRGVDKGAPMHAASVNKSPEGLQFLGWNTRADGKGDTYLPGDTVEVSTSLDLYAQWIDLVTASYADEYGSAHTVQAALLPADDIRLASGWYVADGTVSIDHRIRVGGDVCLILADGCKLSAEQGIDVPQGASLTVYGQSTLYSVPNETAQTQGTGQLIASAKTDSRDAAIGASTGKTAGDVTICGGVITATGGDSGGAGIGSAESSACGTVSVKNGCVTATGGGSSSGIGGDTATITGGVVTAQAGTASEGGAGAQAIGAVSLILGDTMRVSTGDGTDFVKPAERENTCRGARVRIQICPSPHRGSAEDPSSCQYCLLSSENGGCFILFDSNYEGGPEVYSLGAKKLSRITIPPAPEGPEDRSFQCWNTSKDGTGTAYLPGETITLRNSFSLYAQWGTAEMTFYVDEAGQRRMADAVSLSDGNLSLTEGWYVVNGTVTSDNRIKTTGDVRLILADGCTLNAPKGIDVLKGASLTVYGQSTLYSVPNETIQTQGTGQLIAGADKFKADAAIGASGSNTTGTITICGGVITATGGEYGGAGIGRCLYSGGEVNIINGCVTAKGVAGGAGIGGCVNASGITVNISGGYVYADGDDTPGAPGIGSGCAMTVPTGTILHSGTVSITGGVVIVRTEWGQQAIGVTYEYADQDGNGSPETLVLSNGLRVSVGSPSHEMVPALLADRSDACRDREYCQVRIEPCTEHKNDGNGACSYCGTALAAGPVFKSKSLLLSGQIGVNFYMDLSMLTEEEKESAVMDFTVNGKKQTDTFDANCTNPSTGKFHGFTCYINSVQMADEITAELRYTQDGEKKTISQTYSAKEYVDYVLGHTGDFSANAVELVKAIADYGHYVQPFLADANNWVLGTDHAVMAAQNSYGEPDVAAATSAVEGMDIVRSTGDSQIDKVTYSLNLETETAIRIYLKVKEGYSGAVTATMDGDSIDCVKQKDGRYRIEIGGISALRLSDIYNVKVSAGGTCSISVSALSYVNTVLYSESEAFNNETAQFAATSLYRYFAAATAYKANPNG